MDKGQQDNFNHFKVCIIIPTFKSTKTLAALIDSTLEYTSNIIVVHDGSISHTTETLDNYRELTVFAVPKSTENGQVLGSALTKAMQLHYNYVITLYGDGRHSPADLPRFIEAIQKEGDAIYIGSPTIQDEAFAKKMGYGHKISDFLFKFGTGIALKDTQSSYRLYPLRVIPRKYFTAMIDLEREIIVRAGWKGIPVRNIPIRTCDGASQKRKAHFRPAKEFSRISVFNVFLVFITLFHIKPRDFYRGLKEKSLRQFLIDNILKSKESNARKAFSIALGTFIGISPFWGFQSIMVLSLSVIFKLNKAISFTFSNVSFPPFIPFVIYGSLKIGSYFVSNETPLLLSTSMTFADIKDNINQYLIGSFILAAVTAVAFGFLGYLTLTVISLLKNRR